MEQGAKQRQGPLAPQPSFSSAVIFGAAHGIGRAVEQELIDQKASLLVAIDRDQTFLAEKISNPASGHYQLSSDIRNSDQLRRVLQGVTPKAIDLVIFNAGIQNDADPDLTHAINVEGTKNCFYAVKELLSPRAVAVFVSSDMITFPVSSEDTSGSPYVESKREVADFAHEVAKEHPELRVLILLPGPVRTKLFLEGKSEERIQDIERDVGILSPEEFAEMLFQKILPDFASRSSKVSSCGPGAMVRMYKNTGVEWL